MPISWSTVAGSQAQDLESELARRELHNRDMMANVQQAEGMREHRVQEAHASRALDENTALRKTQQAETERRNRETDDDRDTAQFMTAIGMLEPGSQVADPKIIAAAHKRGLGNLFVPDPATGAAKFTGTAAQIRAVEREKEADKRAEAAERRAAEAQARFEAGLQLNRDRFDDTKVRTGILQDAEARKQALAAHIGTLSPTQQIAFRTLLTTEQKKNTGDALYGLTGGLTGTGPRDPLDLVEDVYRKVTGSHVLTPPPAAAAPPQTHSQAAQTGPNGVVGPPAPVTGVTGPSGAGGATHETPEARKARLLGTYSPGAPPPR